MEASNHFLATQGTIKRAKEPQFAVKWRKLWHLPWCSSTDWEWDVVCPSQASCNCSTALTENLSAGPYIEQTQPLLVLWFPQQPRQVTWSQRSRQAMRNRVLPKSPDWKPGDSRPPLGVLLSLWPPLCS